MNKRIAGEPKFGEPAAGSQAERHRLRVLFYLFFPGGGIGKYTHVLLSRLTRFPHLQVELACLPSYHWRAEATYQVWPGLREIGHPWPLRRKARFLIGQYVNPLRLCRRVRETGADIVHFCNINQLTYSRWRRPLRRTGAKVVATVHTVRREKGVLNPAYENRQLRRFYHDADALFVHSEAQTNSLREFAQIDARKVYSVPHGPSDYGRPSRDVPSLRKRYGIPGHKQVVLSFGDIREDKNLDLFLRILPRYKSVLHAVISGRTGTRGKKSAAYYRALIRQLGLQDSVLLLDQYVPDEEVPDLFSLSDWVIMPYSRTFTSQSGVLNLAAHYERPVLLSAAPTLAETVARDDIGILVEPDNEPALERGVAAMIDRVRNGHRHAFASYWHRFSWEENARHTAAVYCELMGTRRYQQDGTNVSPGDAAGK